MRVLLAGLVSLLVSAAFAQDNVPPGGCMPIGLTARGDLVFPMQCRELIERERGPVAEQQTQTQTQTQEQRSQQEPPKVTPAETVTSAAIVTTAQTSDIVTTGQITGRKRLAKSERRKTRELRPVSAPLVTGSVRSN